MAATVANVEYGVMGGGPGGKWVYGEITLDSAYASGGENVLASSFGLAIVKAVFVSGTVGGENINVTITAGGGSVNVRVYSTGSTTTSISVITDRAIGADLSAIVIPVLVRGV